MKKLRLAVLVSGGGSNLQALIDACKAPEFPAEIIVVISNRPDAYGLERAKQAGIPNLLLDHKKFETRKAFDTELLEILKPYTPDLICLAGFMRILTAEFIDHYKNKIINTHPALLPKFGGEGMYGHHVHEAVLNAKESVSGASIHYVIPAVDQGPVILQREVPVLSNDTPDTLAKRVIAQEHILYPEAVKMIAEGLEKGT